MATVLISNQLIQEIRSHVQQMKSDEIKFKLGDTKDADMLQLLNGPLLFLEKLTWGEHAPLARTLPEQWKKRSNRMDIEVVNDKEKISFSCCNINADTWFPPDFQSYKDQRVTLATLLDPDMQAQFPEVKIILETYHKRKALQDIETKWNQTEESVSNYFRACPSLNKGLALQPAMRMYVPKHYLARVDKPSERAKTDREIPQIDGAALAAQAVEVTLARSIHGGAQ